MVEFYLLTFPRFPFRKKEHKSYFGKNRTHDFRTSRCAAYLLDHSGDGTVRNNKGIPWCNKSTVCHEKGKVCSNKGTVYNEKGKVCSNKGTVYYEKVALDSSMCIHTVDGRKYHVLALQNV